MLSRPEPTLATDEARYPDLADVKGQETAKRALEIAAAGGHNLLMIGPPGAGKSMLAQRLPGILPPLTPGEALEVSMIHSVAGVLEGGRIRRARPFRDPHHSASLAALVGGGLRVRPGEVSLAHHGVLFLDELPEFQRAVLELLRQPIESGRAVIARANHHVSYPARFMLVAAMNPCRCGYLADPAQGCGRAPKCAANTSPSSRARCSTASTCMSRCRRSRPPISRCRRRAKTRRAWPRAWRRARAQRSATRGSARRSRTNAEAEGELLDNVATPEAPARQLLTQAAERMRLTARGYHRVLRVARTIADMDGGGAAVRRVHIAEALSYRRVVGTGG